MVELKIFLVHLIFSILITKVIAGCNYKIPKGSPVLLQSMGERKLILSNIKDGQIYMPENSVVEIICESVFKFVDTYQNRWIENPSIDGREIDRDFTISCKNGIARGEEFKQDHHEISCSEYKAEFYSDNNIKYCKNSGLLYGFPISNVSIVAAEFCYDLPREKIDFVHVISGVRSHILEQTDSHPTFWSSPIIVNGDKISMNPINAASNYSESYAIDGYSEIGTYAMYELIPISRFIKTFKTWIPEDEPLNLVPFWTTLKFYNWNEFENALIERSFIEEFDIYAGTSGVVTYPRAGEADCVHTKEFKIETINSNDGTVPKYIWYYIRSRNIANAITDVIVVGVNSPFIENSPSSHILCNDICETIPWLSKLSSTRKMSSLGYIFCCEGKMGYSLFDGFPKMLKLDDQKKNKPRLPGKSLVENNLDVEENVSSANNMDVEDYVPPADMNDPYPDYKNY